MLWLNQETKKPGGLEPTGPYSLSLLVDLLAVLLTAATSRPASPLKGAWMVSSIYSSDHSKVAPHVVPEENSGPHRLTRQQQADLIAWVQVWYDAGCAVHPAKCDGSKMPVAVLHGSPDIQPAVFPDTYTSGRWAGSPHPRGGQPNPQAGQYGYGWKRIATGDLPRLTPAQVAAFIRSGKADGIGVICGKPSGGLFMLEAEGRARDLLPKVKEAAAAAGCLHLLERLAGGCVDESPSGGLHFYARSDDGVVPGNDRLAGRLTDAGGVDVLFETRGQGGWSAVAPSAGRTHKSGKPYRFLRGGPSTIPTFSHDELRQLFDVFRAVDELPKPEPAAARPTVVERRERPAGGVLPGDDYEQQTSWADILTPAGWTLLRAVGDRTHWNRPGMTDGRTRATTTADVLYVFTTSTTLPEGKGLSKFATYAHLNHGGDFAAAARALWELGYGSRGRDDGDGGQPVPVDPLPMPAGPCRTLEDWRAEAIRRHAEVVTQPGTHLNTGGTGSGKTYATNESLKKVSSFLIVLPTHALVEERVRDLQKNHGIEAVAYPEASADNCQRFDVFNQARGLGLVAGAAVCPSCPFNRVPNPRYGQRDAEGEPEPKTIPGPCHQPDQYQGLMAAAGNSGRAACTHERLRRSSSPAKGKKAIAIDELPETVLAPTLHVTSKQVAKVGLLAHGIKNFWYSTANVDQKAFAGQLLAVVDIIQQTVADCTTAGHREVVLPEGCDVPANWQRLLFESIQSVGSSNVNPQALTLVTKAAAGELTSLQVVTDLTKKGRLQHFVVGEWRPDLPADAAKICTDATGNAADMEAVLGCPVNDITPAGHLPVVQRVVQIPTDIDRKTALSTVAGYVEAFAADNPGVQRLGIIGHSVHIDALMADDGPLSEPTRKRIAKWCYFGQGPDRGSNEWHGKCDELLRLGTQRANGGDLRRWLVQHGLHDAASKVDGGWGRRWQGVTVDGRLVEVDGGGPTDPDWYRAYLAVSRSQCQQADGRGRANLPDGIPVTVLSNEPTGYPLAPALTVDPPAARETAEIVRKMGKPTPLPLASGSAKSPIQKSYRENCASGVHRTADVLQAIMAAAGIDERAAQVRLRQCKEAGLLVQPGGKRGWWAVPESADDPVPTVPTPRPAAPPPAAIVPPAIISPPVQAVVISATGPATPSPAVDVVAACPPAATTTTTTSTVQQSDAPAYDDLLELIDERAAIMEFDGGLGREMADRMAREMALGRDGAAAGWPVVDDIVVAVDTPGLHARMHPFVDAVVQRLPGNVRLIDDRGDPFATSSARRQQARPPGVCQCGHDDWVQVSIHGGQSVRVDCRHCDRFGWFGVWHGKRLRGPTDPPDARPADEPVQGPDTISFDFLTLPTGPLMVPAG